MNKQQVQQFLKEQNFQPVKKLGQNFLVNLGLIQAIVKNVQSQPAPFVEIGPGLGALTRHFEKKDILLIEKDKKLANYWSQQGWTVFCEDALKFNWSRLPKKLTLFGNLPYEIAGSLIVKTSIEQRQVSNMLFLTQKEVAERIKATANSKNYGLLSVIAQNFWTISTLFSAPRTDFYPVPKVDGQFLEFKAKKLDTLVSAPLFLSFVKHCFQFKRKMLFKQLNVSSAKDILESLGLPSTCRAENLNPQMFLQLYIKIRAKKLDFERKI